MQKLVRGALAIFFVVAIAMTFAMAQTNDPVVGTWQLNVAKSKYTPGPGPKNEMRTYAGTRTISPDGKVMTIVTKGSDAKGQTVNNVEVFDRR